MTLVGTLGVCVGALAFYPRHSFFWGTIVITAFVFSDTLDGIMARLSGRSGNWGAYLDSTLDRVGDAAIFGGLVLWYAGDGRDTLMAAAGARLPHPRQRRLVLQGARRGAGHDRQRRHRRARGPASSRSSRRPDWWVSACPRSCSPSCSALLAVASLITVCQRMLTVRRQALSRA